MGASDLKGLIEKTNFAISTEETRYYLNGIYLHEARAPAASACARLQPTATGWPRPRSRALAGLPACLASSFRARRCSS